MQELQFFQLAYHSLIVFVTPFTSVFEFLWLNIRFCFGILGPVDWQGAEPRMFFDFFHQKGGHSLQVSYIFGSNLSVKNKLLHSMSDFLLSKSLFRRSISAVKVAIFFYNSFSSA
jgi:hypothetical protein